MNKIKILFGSILILASLFFVAFPLTSSETTILHPICVASLGVAPSTAAVGTQISFDASSSYCTFLLTNVKMSPSSYSFDFGDGAVLNGQNVQATHSYSTPGIYTVRLTISYSGWQGTASKSIAVTNSMTTPQVLQPSQTLIQTNTVLCPFKVIFNVSHQSGTEPLRVTFYGAVLSFSSNFNYTLFFDKGVTNLLNKTGKLSFLISNIGGYTYSAGDHLAVLSVTNGKNTVNTTIMIHVNSSVVNPAPSPAAVNLGTAGNFVILAKSGISTTGTTSIVGDIGVSPAAATYITGFGLIMSPSNQFATSSLVNGRVYAADYAPPTPTTMTTAVSDMETAFTAANSPAPDVTELGAGNIGGMTLAPGVYKWGTGLTIPTDVTLSGNSSDVWIFQIAQNLDIASGKHVILSGGAQAKNIFWAVAGKTTLGTTSVFNGIILDQTAIVLNTGATLNGRALAQTAVTLDSNIISLYDNTTVPSNKPPVACFRASATAGYLPFTAIFVGSCSSDSDGTIKSYSWSIRAENGTVINSQTGASSVFDYTFVKAGHFNVSLAVTDDQGAIGATSLGIRTDVLPLSPPAIGWFRGVPNSGVAPLTTTFWGSAAGAYPLTYVLYYDITNRSKNATGVINFTDSALGTYTYLSGGAFGETYTAELMVSDYHATSYKRTTVQVSPSWITDQTPIVSFTYTPANIFVNNQISFTDLSYDSDGNVTAWLWSFGDNSISRAQNATHAYSTAGTYVVSLTAYDNIGLQNSTTKTLVVNVAVPSPAAVNLGTAGNFVILAKSGISTTGTTSIVGDIGVSPIAATAITGFGLTMDSSNQYSTSSLVNGRVYAADYAPPTPTKMTTAVSDMQTAYTDAAGRTNPDATELGAGDISGMTLYPGLYKWGTGVLINNGVTLDCQGNSSAAFIFQIAQTLDVGNGAIVTLSGGCQASNIFWQVAGQTTLGTTSVFNGIILDKTAIVLNTGATLNGRALAQTAVTLDSNNVSLPVVVTPPAPESGAMMGGGGGGGGMYLSQPVPLIKNNGTTYLVFHPSFALSGIRTYSYDPSTNTTTITFKLTNLAKFTRMLSIRDLIPKDMATSMAGVQIIPVPTDIYNTDPDIGWNVTLGAQQTFTAKYIFNKYIPFASFDAMPLPKVTELKNVSGVPTEVPVSPTTKVTVPGGVTGFVITTLGNPWAGVVIVIMILVLFFTSTDTGRETWDKMATKTSNFISSIAEELEEPKEYKPYRSERVKKLKKLMKKKRR